MGIEPSTFLFTDDWSTLFAYLLKVKQESTTFYVVCLAYDKDCKRREKLCFYLFDRRNIGYKL